MKKLVGSSLIAMFLLTINIAYADIDGCDAFAQLNNNFSASLMAAHFAYREITNSGLVKISGNPIGLSLGSKNVFFDRVYTELYGEFLTGKLQYEGFKFHSGEPLKQKELINLINLDIKLGIIAIDTQFLQVIPYGVFGFHYCSQETGHKYYNLKALGGTRLNIALSDNFIISPYANIGTTLEVHAKPPVFYPDGTYIKTLNLKLGNKLIDELGLELNYRLDHEMFLTAGVSHTHFEYGHSAPEYVAQLKDNIIEPNSKTNELRFVIGIKYGFK